MVQLQSSATILPVNDLTSAVDRYRRLGFEVERYADGGYAFCRRGNVRLHLSEGAVDPAASTTMAYLYVDDPEALHAEWRDVEGRHAAPEVKEWGVREGAYVDPDGNLLRFGVRLDPVQQDTATAEIAEVVESAVRHQSDPEPFLALHADEVVIVNIAGRRVLGRRDLETAMRSALASALADVTTTVDIDDIRFLRPDVALVSCTKHVHDARAEPGDELPPAGAMSYIVTNDGDGWQIALAQTTPIRT